MFQCPTSAFQHCLVFGDPYQLNVVQTEEEVEFIDFDWAGQEGHIRNPFNLSLIWVWLLGEQLMQRTTKWYQGSRNEGVSWSVKLHPRSHPHHRGRCQNSASFSFKTSVKDTVCPQYNSLVLKPRIKELDLGYEIIFYLGI